MAGLLCPVLALAMLQALASAQPSCYGDCNDDLDADQTSLLMKRTTKAGNLSQLSQLAVRSDDEMIEDINEQLAKLQEAYDGNVVDQDTAEINWKQAQEDLQRMKQENAQAALENMQVLAGAAKRAIRLLKDCKESCTAGEAIGGVLEVIGQLGPVLTAVVPSIAPFCPLIGVIGTLLISFFGPKSSAARQLTAKDVENAAKEAMADMGLLEIYADWTSIKTFFEDKTEDYNRIANTLDRKQFSAQDANDYIEKNFVNLKWAAGDKGNFDLFVQDMHKGYMQFAGPSGESIRSLSIANKKPFQAGCQADSSTCRHGGVDAYLCTWDAHDRCGVDTIRNDCFNDFQKVRESWPKVLQVITSFQLLAAQMRLWQISIFSIVSFARGTKDASGRISYPAYTEPGNLLDSITRRLKPTFRLQDQLNTLVKNIETTCNYQGYPLTQYCKNAEDCNYRYVYVESGEDNNDLVNLLMDRFNYKEFENECQVIYDRLANKTGYAQGGMWTEVSAKVEEAGRDMWVYRTGRGNCAELKPAHSGITEKFHLYATQEYCVTHEPCRDLFVNSTHWMPPEPDEQ